MCNILEFPLDTDSTQHVLLLKQLECPNYKPVPCQWLITCKSNNRMKAQMFIFVNLVLTCQIYGRRHNAEVNQWSVKCCLSFTCTVALWCIMHHDTVQICHLSHVAQTVCCNDHITSKRASESSRHKTACSVVSMGLTSPYRLHPFDISLFICTVLFCIFFPTAFIYFTAWNYFNLKINK